ncbi:MAG: glycosyltransferase family 4 protein [Candidatus Levybacteria bacterium]|nr:glycosyltransferase family 4 protein [Candidatus Levybacteria bacterium]
MIKNNYRLKIAQIAPISERVPPKKYGGTERVIHALTEELVRMGHDVTLFASGDSITSAELSSIYPRSLREAKIPDPYKLNELTLANIGSAYVRQKEFDIIHDHNSIFGLSMAHFATTPTLITVHGPFTSRNRKLFNIFSKPSLITISKSQGDMLRDIKILNTIYNGLSMEHYPFSKSHDGYLLYVGRISMEKGLHHAIEVAEGTNLPLIIAAKLDMAEMEYFQSHIEPRLDGRQIRWVGEVGEEERNRLMSRAICLLHPVTWREPFGLTMIEAMACGAPVIAFDLGSIPEIVSNARTGFVVHDTEEMIEAVSRIGVIDRQECRNYALKNFNAETMAKRYLETYYQVIESSKTPHRFSFL